MSDVTLEFGADLSDLQKAFQQVNQHVVKMGARINDSLSKNAAAMGALPRSAGTMANAWHAAFSRISVAGNSAFGKIAASSQAVAGAVGGGLARALPAGGILGGLGALGASVGAAMVSINKAANLESLQTAFTPLLGSADAAKQRIESLTQFANSTPFELPEVAKASRVLEVLTKGALSTGEGLRLVGDVAATTQQPFEEIAMWVGRLYDGLQSGRPVGEALARLQEMGVVSGDVRGRIEELQKSGAAGNKVWGEAQAALSRFSGSMDAQSKTWQGKMSNLKGAVDTALAAFGAPIMNALKPFLDSTTGIMEKLNQKAVEFGKSVATGIRFTAAAFSTGQMGSLLATSLKLAFTEGVNWFFKTSVASIAAVGQMIVENFRTGVEVFSILTTKDFWAGMGNALMAIFLQAVSLFQDGLAKALDLAKPLADLLGKGEVVTNAQNSVRSSAEDMRSRADDYFAAAGTNLGPLWERYQSRLKTALANVSERFIETFANTPELINSGGLKEKLAGIFATIRAGMVDMDKEVADQVKKIPIGIPGNENNPKNDKRDLVAAHSQRQVMSLTRVGGGGFAHTVMNNLVSEAKRQTGYLKAIAGAVSQNPSGRPCNGFA